MSGLDPSGPAQPTLDDSYTTESNPASQTTAEKSKAHQIRQTTHGQQPSDQRIPQKQADFNDATPSSLGRGVHGAGPGEEKFGKTTEDVGRHRELEGEQMAAPGEGRVRDAVVGQGEGLGRSGEQIDLASDLDRKKAEQAPLRDEIDRQKAKDVDVGGVLGQRGGPANPVDKGGYPN